MRVQTSFSDGGYRQQDTERRYMNYTEFVNAMKKEMRERLAPNVKVELYQSIKNNGTRRQGLMFAESGINISPAIYLEEFYEQYQKGRSLSFLAEAVQNIYKRVKVHQSYPCENIFSFSKVKNQIVFKLIQEETNRELLRDVPHEKFLDFAVVFYVLIRNDEFGTATLLVRQEHLKNWGVTRKEMVEAARVNTPRLLPPRLEKLTGYMYVLGNESRNLGASAVCYPGVCRQAAEVLGESFYLIPSSIHEMILIPESYGLEKHQLEQMLREINEKEVEAEEVLSRHVYFFSRRDGKIH